MSPVALESVAGGPAYRGFGTCADLHLLCRASGPYRVITPAAARGGGGKGPDQTSIAVTTLTTLLSGLMAVTQGGHHRTHWTRDVIGLAVVGSEIARRPISDDIGLRDDSN